MAISAVQRQYFERACKEAIDEYYGEAVPDLETYKKRRRATFMEQLKVKLDATVWYRKIQNAKEWLSRARGTQTKLKNNLQQKELEARTEYERLKTQLEADYKAKLEKLQLHYGPGLEEARQKVDEFDAELKKTVRASYFAGLEADYDIDRAIAERVDTWIEHNLDADELGQKVNLRRAQQRLIVGLAYVSTKPEVYRAKVLKFIERGKLPPITMQEWEIELGKDVSEE
jgi:hypothetical protein